MDKNIYFIKINKMKAKKLQEMFKIAFFGLNILLYWFLKVSENTHTSFIVISPQVHVKVTFSYFTVVQHVPDTFCSKMDHTKMCIQVW